MRIVRTIVKFELVVQGGSGDYDCWVLHLGNTDKDADGTAVFDHCTVSCRNFCRRLVTWIRTTQTPKQAKAHEDFLRSLEA